MCSLSENVPNPVILILSLKMLSSAADSQLGGRNIDSILAEHFCQVFKKRYNIDVHTNPRAYLRLLAEVEKLKKQMSVNSTTLPLNIECFMDEKDVHAEIKRTEMEDLCSHLIKRVEATFVQCLVDSSKYDVVKPRISRRSFCHFVFVC